ncbi:stage II sporulation protein D [Microaerobacter geothermalis]|uniref:stage II sporulation protein D n=1 Tax=Microaerobacter geothermalis TaxID=674972 RepID=UPI001F167CD2|nr:stage II sporulation protein D [Microaerobacter geothermalis]MCF6093245.1 stage II sporulation protein D [Microaerobacter geothermalis]
MRKYMIFIVVGVVVLTLFVPAILSLFMEKPENIQNEETGIQRAKQILIPVYRSEKKEMEEIPLEEYIRGVVAAEMPAEFELEALKAQAIAARTYILRRIVEKDFSNVPDGGLVTDTINHQVYLDDRQLKDRWGFEYEWKINKLNQVIKETEGQVITYQGKPINATFFSTSNGYTENSEDYWSEKIPYLRSVPSPWDQESPKFQSQVQMPLPVLLSKLGLTNAVIPAAAGQDWIKVKEWTEGKRIKEIRIAGKTYTGREVRERLGLNSSQFSWEIRDGNIRFTTYGYGHGVGMSQWGANGMAKEGKTAEEILLYYYKGVEIKDYRNWIQEK